MYKIIKVNKNNVTVDNNGRNEIIKNDNLFNNIVSLVLQSQNAANILHKNKMIFFNFIAQSRCKKFENKINSLTHNLHADIYKYNKNLTVNIIPLNTSIKL